MKNMKSIYPSSQFIYPLRSLFSSWQSCQHGASLHQGEAGRGVSIYLTDAHPDPQRRGHQYSDPGGFAGSHGGRPVRQQGPGVAVWKVSVTADDVM